MVTVLPRKALGLLHPLASVENPTKRSELLGNEASLNFVSLCSLFEDVERLRLSRVKMNALWAPLTALTVPAGDVCVLLAEACVFFTFFCLTRPMPS